MAKKGMVVVAIQFRLGIFGFLASSALSGFASVEAKVSDEEMLDRRFPAIS